jgi:hypothetical protein
MKDDVNYCVDCQRKLEDVDYVACGAGLTRSIIFFDYICLNCGKHGRYTWDVTGELNPVKTLIVLSNCLAEAETQETQYSKEKLSFQLNKIKGVKDLLKLAGNDAPHESPRDKDDDGQSNLP